MKIIKKLSIGILFVAFGLTAFGQKYFTKEGDISFYSEAAMEKIEADNKRAVAILDTETGAVEFAVLIKSFQFEKALMQEHFNENYMESSKFPKASFKGMINNLDEVDFDKNSTYEVAISGDLTIHGETNKIETTATLTVSDGSISAISTFVVGCADYGIKIPKVVADNVAKEIQIKIDVDLKPFAN